MFIPTDTTTCVSISMVTDAVIRRSIKQFLENILQFGHVNSLVVALTKIKNEFCHQNVKRACML